MFQLWRLIQFMRNSKNRSTASTQGSTNISIEEAYKLLGLKKVAAKRKSFKPHKNFKKIHPDMNRDINTERLSQLVNEAKEKIIKEDFKD